MDMMRMMSQVGSWGIAMMLLNFLVGLLLLGLFILGIVAGAQWLLGRRTHGTQTPEESALDILKKRYARGELTKEEFEAKKRDIA
ncbi:MAG: SHOCT domain-containing protein [Candidatus Methylomirabilales bacterium]